ncbi:hypothetical protein DX980_29815 [Burkholderia gladioli]|nr:hypothetical protein C6V06_34745 [Burkholderia gladioli]WAG23381.1 hypothetical protein DX980_29815 [Burkholderia gladioli]
MPAPAPAAGAPAAGAPPPPPAGAAANDWGMPPPPPPPPPPRPSSPSDEAAIFSAWVISWIIWAICWRIWISDELFDPLLPPVQSDIGSIDGVDKELMDSDMNDSPGMDGGNADS